MYKLFLCLFISISFSIYADDKPQKRNVLVELFSSQGCNTCPKAEDYIKKLKMNEPTRGRIIPLGYHVDIWNKLNYKNMGVWVDPFSRSEYTMRMISYIKARGGLNATPTLRFNGADTKVNKFQPATMKDIIEETSKVNILGEVADAKENKITIKGSLKPNETLEGDHTLIIYLVEDDITTDIKKGENRGKQLNEWCIVRTKGDYKKINFVEKNQIEYEFVVEAEEYWKKENMQAVVFLQHNTSWDVLQAIEIPLVQKDK